MANYTAADVKKLRELTGAGMMDCKKALDEAEGNVDKAVEILRIKGQKGVAKREGRSAENGAVVSLIADDNTSGVLVELKCETDFVAKGEKFLAVADALAAHVAATSRPTSRRCSPPRSRPARPSRRSSTRPTPTSARRSSSTASRSSPAATSPRTCTAPCPDLPPQIGVLVELDKENAEVAKDIAQHIAAFAPKYLTREDVPAEVVETERRVAEETTREEGKPEAALPKIVEGRVNGFFKDTDAAGASRTRSTTRSPSRRSWTRPVSR